MSRSSSERAPVWYIVFAGVIILLLVVGGLAFILDPGGGTDDSGAFPTQPSGAQIALLETAVAKDTQDSRSMAVLADILANDGRLQEAVTWYNRAIELEPQNATYRVAFARALQGLGSDFDARIQYERAIELEPDNQSATFYFGFFNETLDPPDWDAAVQWFRRTIEIDPSSVISNQAEQRISKIEQTLGTPAASPSKNPATPTAPPAGPTGTP